MKRKSLLFLLLMAIFAPWAAKAQTTGCEAIGEESTSYGAGGSSGYGYVPIDTYYKYSYEQMVYDGSEMPTTITSISFKYKSNYAMTEKDDVDIYLGEATTATLDSWMPASDLTLVYSGALDFPVSPDGAWVEFTFNQNQGSFSHDQSKYIVVVINDKSNGYPSYYYSMYFCYQNCASGAHKYLRNDSYGEYTVPPTSTGSNASQCPIVRFCGTFPVICCPKPKDLACTGTTGTPATATFTWTNGGEETQWQLEYGTASDFSGASTVTINQSDLVNGAYTLTGLTAEQTYYARIKAYCPSCEPNYSDWSNTVNFKPTNAVTACEDFEGVTGTSYSTEGNMPEGWYPYTTATGTSIVAPHVCSGSSYNYYHSASQSLVFESGTNANGNAAYAVMPANTVDGDYVSLTFYTRVENTSYGTLQIGYVTAQNAAACNNFTPLASGTITSSTTIHKETIDVSSVPSDAFIAFKWQSTTGTYYACGVDDVCLSILPNPTPRPRNLQVSNITSSGATVSWQAPASATPTSYQYRYNNGINWTGWESTADLSVDLTLTASTPYTVQVKAIYDGVGESASIETDFTTLDNCAYPTNLMPYTVAGEGTTATLSWVKGYDETAWVLEYATDELFTVGLQTVTDGFIVDGNNVTCNLNVLTPEQTYYARVKANCDGPTSSWSNVVSFTPTNYVDFQYMENPTTTVSVIPFSGSYTTSTTDQSQFIIPKSEILDMAGGTIRRITYYSSTANTNWGGVTFDVYMAEVQNETFSSATFIDWTTLTNVYTGTVSLQDGMMAIEFGNNYTYNGGNLLIGFKLNTAGTAIQSVSWRVSSGSGNRAVYQYGTNNASTSTYRPKITFNYQPSPYKKPVINEPQCTFGTITAHIAWTVPFSANPTGYQYQYKLATATEWPTTWTSVTAATAYADLSDLTPGSFYDFRVKALYEGNHESAVVNYEFWTQCAVVTAFPWKEDFEGYNTGNFSHPCWVNQHLSGNGSYLYSVVTESMGDNNTKQLKLNDQSAGTETMLRLPEMNLPGNDYQFVIDVYRNTSTYQENPYELEGIHVYVSTNGNLEGATELAYIPRHKDVSNSLIPAEEETGWYTYEIPVGISGNCYIILKGVNQWCTSIYMDNFGVEQIPTCARPSALAKSEVTNHSAKLSWTAGDTGQTLWQIAYSKTTFDPNTASFDITTVTTIDATGNPFTLDKILDAASTYCVYVRANCGTATEPDYGPWCRKGVSLTTLAAAPAPSNFVASNPASAKIDLVWNAGGGDLESWELYYVASETAPEAPTATTAALKTVTTLPTTEAPYVLDGLNPVTKYYAWVRAKHVWNSEATYSDWVALTGNYFETLDACPTPYDLAVSNITPVSANISWTGSTDVNDYTVQYRLSEKMVNPVLDQEFGSSAPTGWTGGNVALDEGVADVSEVTSNNWSFSEKNSVLNGYHAWMNLWTYSSVNYWLVTPGIAITEGQVLSFDVAYTAYGDGAPVQNCTTHSFGVYASTDKKNWTPLRVWDNSGSPYVLDEIDDEGQTVSGISLNGFADETIYIGFLGHAETNSFDNNIHVDNVKVASVIPAGPWTDATTDETSLSYTLPGLTAGTKYDVQVKSNCTNGEWSTPITFTTLADGNKVFTNAANDGLWGTAGNWVPTGAPVLTDNAILRANATIESDIVAEAKKITFEGTPTPTLTIADGGQLMTDTEVTATVKKNITGYGAGNTNTNLGYHFISKPIKETLYNHTSSSTPNISTTGLLTGSYDLYKWTTGSAADYLEWRNYEAEPFNLTSVGFLYANENDVELTFTGTVRANNSRLGFNPSTNYDYSWGEWNLIGNYFVCNAYFVDDDHHAVPFYKMNDAGDGYTAVTGEAVPPVTGIFYQNTAHSGSSVYFERTAPVTSPGQGNLNINLAQVVTTRNEQPATDNAIIRFDGGQQLGKFSFRQGSTKVFITEEGKDYAVVSADHVGEIPVSFKAETSGSYTLSFTSQEVSFSYLHLIDNLTGNDVDLLQTPSYSFDAQITDYAQRFRLVFAIGSSVDGDSFGFINGMGNLCIFGIEGEATIQVIDILGHVITSDTFSGSYERKLNVAPGVYMIRLINGNDVKVQKIVVR